MKSTVSEPRRSYQIVDKKIDLLQVDLLARHMKSDEGLFLKSNKKNLTEFSFQAFITEFRFRFNPGSWTYPSFEQPGPRL